MIVHIKGTDDASTKVYKQELKKAGFKWKATGKYTGDWSKNVADKDLERTQHWCEEKGLRYIPQDPNYSRVKGYREIYFDTHKPIFKNKYICSYCGKLLLRKDCAVDHVYPISAVQEPKKKLNRFIMTKIFKINNINDPSNLTSACDYCNKKKGSKTGFWVIRGKLGQHASYWVLLYIIVFSIMAVAIFTLLKKVFGF